MREPKITHIGPDGVTGVHVDGVPLEDHAAQDVIRIRNLYEKGHIARHEYMKYLRRLKAKAESGE